MPERVFEYLEGMVRTPLMPDGQVNFVPGAAGETIEWDGESLHQSKLIFQESCDRLVGIVRETIRKTSKFGETGSLIMLGTETNVQDIHPERVHVGQTGTLTMLDIKGHLHIGTQVKSAQVSAVQLRGFGGQSLYTSSAHCWVKEKCRNGVVVEDRTCGNGIKVFVFLAYPNQAFEIVADP